MKNWVENLGFGIMIIILALYPIYANMVYGLGYRHAIHQRAFIEGEIYFFNPWQYRVLAPYLIEGIARTVKYFLNLPAITDSLYFTIFKSLRFFQHLVIFGLAYKFYYFFTKNRLLIFFSIITIASAIGHSTYASDFSFTNYFDIICYQLAVLIIFYKKDILWFLPLTFFAILNRETSLLIPFILFLNYKSFFSGELIKKSWLVFAGSLLIYATVFIVVRLYYGYQPAAPIGMETGLPMLRFNLTDPATKLQLLGAFSIFPIFALFNIRKVAFRLQILFWLLVPVWFAIHFWLVWARETRLFLVPFIVVFLPVILALIQKSFEKNNAN